MWVFVMVERTWRGLPPFICGISYFLCLTCTCMYFLDTDITGIAPATNSSSSSSNNNNNNTNNKNNNNNNNNSSNNNNNN